MMIDDHAVRMLRTGLLDDEDIRRVVATQKIANDLERIGRSGREYLGARDFPGRNECECQTPPELEPMSWRRCAGCWDAAWAR